VLEETKNSERRSIPITGLAARLLRDRRRERGFRSDLIFAKRDGKAGFPESAWRWSVASATNSLQAESEEAAESAFGRERAASLGPLA
jgi:integrase